MKIIKMDKKIEKEQNRELEQFCRQIREYVQSGRIRECEQLIPQYMQVFCGKLQYGAVQFFCEKVYDKTCVWMGRLREERHTSWYKHIRQKK